MSKKDETRFTIKFNPSIPRHREAMRILNEAGRWKAALIADALCLYAHYGADMGAGILRGVPLIAAQGQVGVCDITVESTEVCKVSDTSTPDDDALLQSLANNVDSFFDPP